MDPDPIAYLDTAAGTAVGRSYKQRFVRALDVRPGHLVLDIGCGPGTDLARLAGTGATVLGLDPDPGMLAEARRRLGGRPGVLLCRGDAHALPLAGATVDRIRADRVLQHLPAPAGALAEVRRVMRPGGLFGLAEPDWETLAVADPDERTSRRFARFVAGRVRNATIGRQATRLCEQAGLRVESVDAVPVTFQDFGTADQILGLRRNADRAVRAGDLTEAEARPWLRRLAGGPFLAGFTFYLVTARSNA
ncbi:methyltransferase domain-containing protein [Jidongwangia harbinensis]|uniref:methyltransferase domain-containing protein n=1 Tax=Jidongwangia harbinensis TaxID=2878561 RepID=UPI001CD9472B|nr:methyltransferase domain-containing protein [Jidongwangia harbinensis]MCA2214339.1 methyltransferase domain-containing protein [Jidongwangia harbinensis]